MRELLRREHDVPTVVVPPGQVRRALSPPVENEHAGRLVRRRDVRGRGMRDVMRDEADERGVQPGERRHQEERRAPRVEGAEALPSACSDVAVRLRGEIRVVRVRDGVEVGGIEARGREAPARRLLGELPRREGDWRLPVLPAAEALLLGGGDGDAVDDESGCRVVEDGVDPQYARQVRDSFLEGFGTSCGSRDRP